MNVIIAILDFGFSYIKIRMPASAGSEKLLEFLYSIAQIENSNRIKLCEHKLLLLFIWLFIYVIMKRDVGTTGRRHDGTKAQRDVGTTGRRHDGTTGRRDDGTTGRRDDGTTGRRDDGTTGRRDVGTTGRRDDGTTGRRDDGTKGRVNLQV